MYKIYIITIVTVRIITTPQRGKIEIVATPRRLIGEVNSNLKKILALSLFLFILLLPMYVNAHAYLKDSYPTHESSLDYSPVEIVAHFSESINTNLSKLTLKDEDGNIIVAEQVSENNLEMKLLLPTLENGVYTVYWQILAKDTHVTEGSFRFTIDAPVEVIEPEPEETPTIDEVTEEEVLEVIPSETELIEEPPLNEHLHNQHETQKTYHAGTYVRFFELLILITVAGLFFFRTFFFNNEKLLFFERVLYLVAVLTFILTGFTQVMVRALQLTNQHIVETFLTMLTTTNLGIASIAKPILFLLLFLVSFNRMKGNVIAPTFVFLALFTSFAWSGHAAGNFLAIFSHVIHLVAASLWFGGIIGFVLYSLFGKRQLSFLHEFHEKLVTFSRIALWSIVAITGSGLILSFSYLPSWENLINSNYGITLLWKLLTFTPALLIAAYHRFVWLPQLRKNDVKKVNRLFWSLRIELILIVIIVIIAGFLSSTSPPMIL